MARLAKHKTVREALAYVTAHPEWSTAAPVDAPVWEHVARALFDISLSGDMRVVGSMNRATRAQKIILDRTTGTRRAGTHPAQRSKVQIQFQDMTGGEIDA